MKQETEDKELEQAAHEYALFWSNEDASSSEQAESEYDALYRSQLQYLRGIKGEKK